VGCCDVCLAFMAIMVSSLIGIRIYIHISFSVYFTFLYIYINDWNLVHTCIMVACLPSFSLPVQ